MTEDQNSNKKEKIIKDLLYEKSAKDLLLKDKKSKGSISIQWLMRIAALVLLIIVAWTANNYLFKQSIDKKELAISQYEFPAVTKSRSAQSNIIDNHLDKLRNQEYSFVLDFLGQDTLSEKDLFVKAHILFSLDSLDAAQRIIESNNWEDEYYNNELKWLDFLIDYSSNKPKDLLIQKMNALPSKYQFKANSIINQ